MNLKKAPTCIDESEGLVCHCRSRFFRVIGKFIFIFTNIIYRFKNTPLIQRCSFTFLVEKMETWTGSNKTWRTIVPLEWIGSWRVVQRGVYEISITENRTSKFLVLTPLCTTLKFSVGTPLVKRMPPHLYADIDQFIKGLFKLLISIHPISLWVVSFHLISSYSSYLRFLFNLFSVSLSS